MSGFSRIKKHVNKKKRAKSFRVISNSKYIVAIRLNRSQNWPYAVNYQAARDKAIDNGAEVQHRFVR